MGNNFASWKPRFLLLSAFLLLLLNLSCSQRLFEEKKLPVEQPGKKAGTLEVLLNFPTGTVEAKGESREIGVSFNHPMVPLEALSEEEKTGIFSIEPHVSGKYRWRGTTTLVFTPDKPLPQAGVFRVNIPAGTKALTGEYLDRDFLWTFETLRPDLVESIPADELKWVVLDHNVYLRFNQAMSSERAYNFIRWIGSGKTGKEEVAFFLRGLKKEEATKDMSGWEPEKTLVLVPRQKLRKGYTYQVNLLHGLPAREGELGLENDRAPSFSTYNEFRYTGSLKEGAHSPDDAFPFAFSNPVKYSELLKNLTIEPKIKMPSSFDFYEDHNDRLSLFFPFEAEKRYRLTISPKLQDIFGNRLGKEIKIVLRTISFHPYFSMSQGEGIVEADGDLKHPVDFMNIKKVQKKLALIPREKIIPLFLPQKIGNSQYERVYGKMLAVPFSIDTIWLLNIPRNQERVLPLDLREILPANRHGIVWVKLYDFGQSFYSNYSQEALLQVTGLGITGKFSPENNLLMVTRLQDAQPVPDARVEIRDDDNRVLWNGRTDAQGLVESPGWAKLNPSQKALEYWRERAPRQWVFASSGDDLSLITSDWGWGIEPYSFGIPYSYRQEAREFCGFLFSERGLYRAGEEVCLKGTLREKKWGRWEIPSAKAVSVIISNSRDEEVLKKRVSLSSYGSFHLKFSLKNDAPSGYYSVKAGRPDNKYAFYDSFRVEAFQPATFEVTATSNQKGYIVGDKFSGVLKGWYLFGAPMNGDKITWSLRLSPGYFNPPDWEGFAFGPSYFWDEESSPYEDEDHLLASGEGTLDSQGHIAVQAIITPSKSPRCMGLVLEGTVTAANRQSISGRTEALRHPGDFYIGLKPSTTFLEEKKNLSLDVISVDTLGKPSPGEKISLKIFRREWNSVRKAGFEGRYEWICEKKDQEVFSNRLKTPAKIDFSPKSPGLYIIQAEGADRRGNKILTSTDFYASGSGYVSWFRRDDDRIELVSDKKKYAPGDVARILVKSPYEKARALVTLEREYIMEKHVVNLTGSAPTIEIPIKSAHLPNIFVSVILLKGRTGHGHYSPQGADLGKPAFKIGYLNLPVETGEKKLLVNITSDKKTYRPGEKVKAGIQVTDANKRGVRAEVCFAAVDLGVLNLISYQTPDYFDAFYYDRFLSVATAESRLHVIGERNYGQKGVPRGGGGGILASDFAFRKNFKATAYWNPEILTDNEGRASLSFVLPENLTTFRLMATAQTKDSCFGAGENKIIVKKPLLLKPSLPRFALIEDTFKGGVLVFNDTGKAGKVKVAVKAQGIAVSGETEKEIEIPAGEEKEVLFSFHANKTGQALLSFGAVLGGAKDGLMLPLPIKAPRLFEAVALFEETSGDARQELVLPGSMIPGTGTLNIALSSSALVGLKSGVEALIAYPYECLEQRLSKIIPLILAEDLVNTFDIPSVRGRELRQRVNDVLQQVPLFQTSNGGFCYWGHSESDLPESPYLSAYTMYVLAMAKRNGYQPDPALIRKGKHYLKNVLREHDVKWNYPYSYNEQLTTKCLILYALALWENSEPSYLNLLYERLGQISLFGKTLLLKTAHIQKEKEIEGAISKAILNKAKVAPTSAHFEEEEDLPWLMHSNVRTTALILQSLLETRGAFPLAPRIARWLVEGSKAERWRTTQENAYLFDALSTYYKVYEKEEPDFSAVLLFKNKKIMQENFQGRELEVRSRTLPVDNSEKKVSLDISKKGRGRLYYEVRMKYAPLKVLPRDEGILVLKRIEPLEGKTNELKTYRAGALYKVILSILTPQERHFVVVDDPIPAGFEIVDTSFSTESQDTARKLLRSQSTSPDYWWGTTFDHWEIYDDRILLFADGLYSGEHVFTYCIKAMHPGKYYFPACQAEEMYTPEVFGRTPDGSVEIRE